MKLTLQALMSVAVRSSFALTQPRISLRAEPSSEHSMCSGAVSALVLEPVFQVKILRPSSLSRSLVGKSEPGKGQLACSFPREPL